MSMGHTRPSEARPPLLEILPDLRKRLTRFRTLSQGSRMTDALIQAWGTVDVAPATAAEQTAGFTGLRLINQRTAEPGSVAGVPPTTPIWLEVYETIPATGEVQVGSNTRIKLEDGREAIEAEFLQFASDTYVPGTVGTTTAPGDSSAFLKESRQTNDGALRRITRQYVYAGTLATDDQSLNNGKLLKKTIVSVKTAPSTPSGFTLVGSPVQSPNGLPVFTYTYYKGDGETSRRSSDDAGGKLQRVVITHLTASSVTSQPTTDPLSGGVAIVTGLSDESGHRVWEVTWAKGVGEVARRTSDRFSGMLQRVTITHLTATSVSTQPTTDPLSGGTLLEADWRDEAGHRVWTAVWTKANTASLITNSTRKLNQGKLVVYRRSRFGAAPAAPSATIGGTVVETDTSEQLEDGYTLYAKEWAEGTGTIEDSKQLGNQGKLVTYRQRALAVAPSAPSATIGGTVVLTQDASRDADGVTYYDRTWAEGRGVYAKRTQPREGGLRLETWESLGASYDDAFMKPAGLLMARDHDDLDGATRWTVTCMQKKDGTALAFSSGQLTAINVVSGGNSYSSDPTVTIGAPPSGGVQATATAVRSGSVVSSVTITNPGSGYLTAPAIGFTGGGGADASATATIDGAPETALEFEIKHPFDYPGRAKVITTTLETNPCFDVYKSPPIRVLIDATLRVSYQTANELGALPYSLWNPEEWTSIFAKFRSYPDGWPRTISESLPGYRAVSTTPTTFDGGLSTAKLQTCLGEKVAEAVSGTPFSLQLAGGPVDPEGNTYLIARPELEPAFSGYDGTQYYRKTVIFATIPAQPALPV